MNQIKIVMKIIPSFKIFKNLSNILTFLCDVLFGIFFWTPNKIEQRVRRISRPPLSIQNWHKFTHKNCQKQLLLCHSFGFSFKPKTCPGNMKSTRPGWWKWVSNLSWAHKIWHELIVCCRFRGYFNHAVCVWNCALLRRQKPVELGAETPPMLARYSHSYSRSRSGTPLFYHHAFAESRFFTRHRHLFFFGPEGQRCYTDTFISQH